MALFLFTASLMVILEKVVTVPHFNLVSTVVDLRMLLSVTTKGLL